MKVSILKRLEAIEKETNLSKIDQADRVVVIKYPYGDDMEYERQKQKRMAELRKKYGPNISENDFSIIGIKKFYKKT